MKTPKLCAVQGPAGEDELAGLITYAVEGWNIAFMDPDKKKGENLKQKLVEECDININVVNEKNYQGEIEGEIEGFFFHGRWEDEEDVDIYWGFIEGKYGGASQIIGDSDCQNGGHSNENDIYRSMS